ncbi:MAG: hypothetical protein HY867_14865 [Chloroflexi bacterium]|nr:hypothetical protein [Chloroflexota bacterium]
MKYLRLYLKIFFWTAMPIVVLGILASIGLYILFVSIPSEMSGIPLDLIRLAKWVAFGFIPGIMFGGIMAVSLGTSHILRIRSLPTQEPDNISLNQSRMFILETDQHRAFSLCSSSLMLISAKLQQANEATGYIMAKTPAGWGEVIEIKVSPISDNKSQIVVTSRPNLKTVLVDYGKNTENVEKICWYLKDKLNT